MNHLSIKGERTVTMTKEVNLVYNKFNIVQEMWTEAMERELAVAKVNVEHHNLERSS